MSWSYSCPHCGAMLSPHHTIMLVAEHGDRRTLIGFHPEPGNYQVFLPPGEEVREGEVWTFRCPLCQQDLSDGQPEGLCALDLHGEAGTHRVLFSRVAGEQATFVIGNEGLAAQHGVHADRYRASLANMKYILEG